MQRVSPKLVDYLFLRGAAILIPGLLVNIILIALITALGFIMLNIVPALPVLEQEFASNEPATTEEALATFQNTIDSLRFPTGLATGFVIVAILFILLPLLLLWIWARLTYRFLRYELAPSEFRQEFGILSRQALAIPYERIQNLEIHRDVFARMLGLSTLDIQTAGTSRAEARLPGLPFKTAEKIREELLKRSKTLSAV